MKIESVLKLPLLVLLNKCEQKSTSINENSNNSKINELSNTENSSNFNKNSISNHSIKISNGNGCNNVDDIDGSEHLRLQIYELINVSPRLCDDFAILSISALENLNVYKSALWILDVILENIHK